MLSIVMLINEHTVIARAGEMLRSVLPALEAGAVCPPEFLYGILDFLRTYVGECHFGKEETLLFGELEAKPQLPEEIRLLLTELRADHARFRESVEAIAGALGGAVSGGQALAVETCRALRTLVEQYPRHLEAEERQLFYPAREYLSATERRLLVRSFQDFDQQLIHQTYQRSLTCWEARGAELGDRHAQAFGTAL